MWLDDQLMGVLRDVTDRLAGKWHCPMGTESEQGLNLAGQRAVHRVLDDLITVLFPGCHGSEAIPREQMGEYLAKKLRTTVESLGEQIRMAFEYQCTVDDPEECRNRKCSCGKKSRDIAEEFLRSLPEVWETLQADVVAAYEGDPAAKSIMEVVQSYPGVLAIIVHRLAHVFYRLRVPLIPRIMSERAHSLTGIDIHPGAEIGPAFFIDHGTGVVIGETCDIGRNVKIYQGVTLGALSFQKDEQGRLVKGIKRHPNVEEGVVIYAGATILGGKTTIGAHSVIGGNVWLTHSVPPHSKVYNQQPSPLVRQADGQWRVADGPWKDFGGGI